MKQSTYFISALILGASIIISTFIIIDAFSESASEESNLQVITNSVPDLMTKMQLSEYLQISEQSIESIIGKDDFEKRQLGSYETYRFIPYLKIDDQERFLKTEINEWLKYQNDHRYD